MGRRKKPAVETPDLSAHWIRTDTFMANGRHIEKGTELSIQGERGRFKFVQHVYNPRLDVEWIDVIGGKMGVKEFRAFRPTQIKRVHYKNKIRPVKKPTE
jgi:hypothetical protein